MGGRAFHNLVQQRKQKKLEYFHKVNNSAGCWWQQHCDPRSCSLCEGKKELLGTNFWLKNHGLQPVVETNHPPIEVSFFFFFHLWMTGHLWCHASTGWAFLLDRNWCHGLSDRGVIEHTGHILWHQQEPFFVGTDSDEREQLQLEGQSCCQEVVRVWTCDAEEMWPFCATVLNHMATHGLVMHCHMCIARAPPTTCCSSRVLFLSWDDVCHCGEIL